MHAIGRPQDGKGMAQSFHKCQVEGWAQTESGRDANRTRQKERQEWHAGKEVGSRKDGRVGRTEFLIAKSVGCRNAVRGYWLQWAAGFRFWGPPTGWEQAVREHMVGYSPLPLMTTADLTGFPLGVFL